MADVLSQSEIDALLKSMQSAAPDPDYVPADAESDSGESDPYSKYDFYSPRKFTKEKLKLLRSIFENYARILTSQVNGIFRILTDITLLELRESRYYEFVNSFHENDIMSIIDTYLPEKGKHNVPMMVHLSQGLVITLANRMLGGGDQVIAAEEDYRYTDVEVALYQRVVEYVIRTLSDGFSNYLAVDFKLQRVEENPSMMQEVGLDETVMLITMNVDVSGISSERIRICIPGTLLEHIFHVIDNKKHLARGFSYENNSDTIMNHIRVTKYPVIGQLSRIQLTAGELSSLQVGDIIDLSKPVGSEVTVFVGDHPWFKGHMGVHKKNIAVQIERRISPENEKYPNNAEGGRAEDE